MQVADWIQAVIAAFTAAAVTVAAISLINAKKQARADESAARKQAREEAVAARDARHEERILEAAQQLAAEMGLASAELLPYWKPEATKPETAPGVSTEIAVHRHVEVARTWAHVLQCLLNPRVENDTAARGLKGASEMCERALMATYFALVQDKSIEVCRKQFMAELSETALDQARAVDVQATKSGEGSAQYTARLVDLAQGELFEHLGKFTGVGDRA